MTARDDYPYLSIAAAEQSPTLDQRFTAQVDDALDEIDRLRRWKAEATIVLNEWEHVWKAAGRPGQLGQSKAIAVEKFLLDKQP